MGSILVPWPGIQPRPLAVQVACPNHQMTREFLSYPKFLPPNMTIQCNSTFPNAPPKAQSLSPTQHHLPLSQSPLSFFQSTNPAFVKLLSCSCSNWQLPVWVSEIREFLEGLFLKLLFHQASTSSLTHLRNVLVLFKAHWLPSIQSKQLVLCMITCNSR